MFVACSAILRPRWTSFIIKSLFLVTAKSLAVSSGKEVLSRYPVCRRVMTNDSFCIWHLLHLNKGNYNSIRNYVARLHVYVGNASGIGK